jgi:hypothetical protein
MTVPPSEYEEEGRFREQPERLQEQPENALPPDREDAPEQEIGQHERQGREVKYLDTEDHEAHAPGRVCARCGAVITAGQEVRRLASGQWIHEVCPVGPGGLQDAGQRPPGH